MGIDRIYHHFYRLFGGTEYLEENSYNNSFVKLGSEIVILDGNFILYDIIFELEQDLNKIVKLILTIPHTLSEKRENIIKEIMKKINNCELRNIKDEILEIFENENIEVILKKLGELFNLKNDKNLYDKILGCYYLDFIEKKILNLHYIEFIKEFYLVFDGIPSMPKIIEQKRRKLKNFVESTIRKLNIEEKFNNMPNFLYPDENGNYFDYNLFIKNKISLSKSFGPTSNIFSYLENLIINKKYNFKVNVNNTNNFEEADYKIFNLLKQFENKTITLHCSDFDFIFYGILISIKSNNKINMIRHFKDIFLYVFFPKLIINMITKISHLLGNTLSENIINDIILIISFFGNDYLPDLIELSFENNFLDLCKIFYENFWIKNEIVFFDKIDKTKLYVIFTELNKKAKRFYLENYLKSSFTNGNHLYNILPEEINTLEDLRNKILLPYWLNLDKIELEYNDIRNNLNEYQKENFPVIYPIINEKLSTILISTENPLGLRKKQNYPNLDMNPFENLYNNQVFISQNLISNKFKTLENKLIFRKNLDEFDEEKNYLEQISINPTNPEKIVNKYLEVLETYFSKFNNTKLNKIHYNYYLAPKIEWIYTYFNNKNNEISTIKTENYFDNILHLIFISPHQNFEETEDSWIINFIETNKKYFLLLDKNENITIDILVNKIKELNYRQIDIINLIEKWKIYLTNINYQYYKSHIPLIETEFITSLTKPFS